MTAGLNREVRETEGTDAGRARFLAIALSSALIAEAGEKWTAAPSAKGAKNPVAKAAGLTDGKQLVATNCALCHGDGGKGDGPAGANLTPRPRNLGDKTVQVQADGELFWKISEGRGMMPSFKSLPEKDRWSLVHYIRSFAASKR